MELRNHRLPLVMLALAWGLTIRALWPDWRFDPQYHYGMLVPLLCLFLARQRWLEAPAPSPPAPGVRGLAEALSVLPVLALAVVIVWFPANPDWRMLGAVSSAAAIWLTLLWIYEAGGAAWLRHHAFPVCFFFVAVPWPRAQEAEIMRGLMGLNAGAALELARLAGYEAYRRGHLIELPTGVVGVEEACSGIRSLQGTLMAALFFGELLRLAPWRRVALLGIGVAAALAGNVIRTTALTVIAAREGVEAVDSWHDTAGLWALGGSLAAIWVAARLLARPETPRGPGLGSPARGRSSVSPAFALGALALLSASLVGAEAWYWRPAELEAREEKWRVESPARLAGMRAWPIPARTESQLRYDAGMSGRWTDEEGLRWQYFYFRWEEENAAQVGALHDPRACLAAIGMRLEHNLPPVAVAIRGVGFTFRAFLFRDQGLPVHVFQAVVEDGEMTDAARAIGPDMSYGSRWLAVKNGRRFRGRRIIELAVWGTEELAEATAGLEAFLRRSIVVEDRGAQPDAARLLD